MGDEVFDLNQLKGKKLPPMLQLVGDVETGKGARTRKLELTTDDFDEFVTIPEVVKAHQFEKPTIMAGRFVPPGHVLVLMEDGAMDVMDSMAFTQSFVKKERLQA